MNEFDTLLPVTNLKRLGSLHNVIPLVLRRTSESLSVGVIEHTSERPRNDLLLQLGVVSSLGHERNLEQHGGNEVGAFEEFEVDVHVEGKLSLAFNLVLLGRESRVPLSLNSLSEELLDSLRREDLLKSSLTLANEAQSESAKTDLNDRSVVENLGPDVGASHGVLEMGHEEHITRGVVLVVEGVVVDVGKHGTGTEERIVGLVEVDANGANEGEGGEGSGRGGGNL